MAETTNGMGFKFPTWQEILVTAAIAMATTIVVNQVGFLRRLAK